MYFIEYNRLVLEEPNIYQNLGDFTRMRVIVFRALSDCEELSGGQSQEIMGLVLGSLLLSNSIHIVLTMIYDV